MPDGPKVLGGQTSQGDFGGAVEAERVLSAGEIGAMVMEELRAQGDAAATDQKGAAPWSHMQAH